MGILKFSNDGQMVACASKRRWVELFDLCGSHTLYIPLPDEHSEIFSLLFAPDSQQLASIDTDGMVAIADLARQDGQRVSGYRSFRLSTDKYALWSDPLIAFTGDRQLMSVTDFGVVEVWDTQSGELVGRFKAELNPSVKPAISADGSHFAFGRGSDEISIRSTLPSPHPVFSFRHPRGAIDRITFSPGKTYLALEMERHAVIAVYHIDSSSSFNLRAGFTLRPGRIKVLALAFGPHDRQLVVLLKRWSSAGGISTFVQTWNPMDGHCLGEVNIPRFCGYFDSLDLVIAQERAVALVRDHESRLFCVDVEEPLEMELCALMLNVGTLTVSACGTKLATLRKKAATREEAAEISIWNLKYVVPEYPLGPETLEARPDPTLVASISTGLCAYSIHNLCECSRLRGVRLSRGEPAFGTAWTDDSVTSDRVRDDPRRTMCDWLELVRDDGAERLVAIPHEAQVLVYIPAALFLTRAAKSWLRECETSQAHASERLIPAVAEDGAPQSRAAELEESNGAESQNPYSP